MKILLCNRILLSRKSNHAVEISITDSGPGVAAEVTDTIFEPFVTTKPLGMGMGLSISRSIVESHGGKLRMVRSVRSGAIFIFDLPTAGAEASVDAARPGYKTGLISASSLLEAERTLVDMKDRYFQAVADYYRRLATLERAIGGSN